MSHYLSVFLKLLVTYIIKTVAIVQILLKSPQLMSTKSKATALIKYKIKGSHNCVLPQSYCA